MKIKRDDIFPIKMDQNQQSATQKSEKVNQYSPAPCTLLTDSNFWKAVVDFDPFLAGEWTKEIF